MKKWGAFIRGPFSLGALFLGGDGPWGRWSSRAIFSFTILDYDSRIVFFNLQLQFD